MLKRSHRITTKLFPAIIERGATHHVLHFYSKVLRVGIDTPTLFSVVVPKKIEKTAVARASLKRRVTAVLRKHLTGIKKGYQVLLFCKKDAKSLSPTELSQEIQRLLITSNLLQ